MTAFREFTVFEHEHFRPEPEILKALQHFHGEDGVPYFSLTNNGVRFCEFVGVLQVGKTIIHVLPKADRGSGDRPSKTAWKEMLIGMLREVGGFDIHAPSVSALTLKPNSILDLYIQLFLREVQYLLQRGLTKQYRSEEGNRIALKGQLNFSKHLAMNIVHKERFYVRFTTYDVNHKIHRIIYKTLKLIAQLNTNSAIQSEVGNLLLNFPEMDDIKVSDTDFSAIVYNRKTDMYRNTLAISRLLLLNYHPDVDKGRNDVLALMFDMNLLWERFVHVSLLKYARKVNKQVTITAQYPKNFWKPERGHKTQAIPDLVVKKDHKLYILDTKWKNLNGYNPSPDDLRQMYVYNELFDAEKSALVYPGESSSRHGRYYDKTGNASGRVCSVISLNVDSDIAKWQNAIGKVICDCLGI